MAAIALFERLAPAFQQEYRRAMTIEGWEGYLAATAWPASAGA